MLKQKIKKLICKFKDHYWVELNSPYKRMCLRCGLEQWLMEKRFPGVGEPKYNWETMHRIEMEKELNE